MSGNILSGEQTKSSGASGRTDEVGTGLTFKVPKRAVAAREIIEAAAAAADTAIPRKALWVALSGKHMSGESERFRAARRPNALDLRVCVMLKI